jgi:hypothetical protein
MQIRAGLRDGRPITPKGNKLYEGTETREKYQDPRWQQKWNVSVEVTNRELEKNHKEM